MWRQSKFLHGLHIDLQSVWLDQYNISFTPNIAPEFALRKIYYIRHHPSYILAKFFDSAVGDVLTKLIVPPTLGVARFTALCPR